MDNKNLQKGRRKLRKRQRKNRRRKWFKSHWKLVTISLIVLEILIYYVFESILISCAAFFVIAVSLCQLLLWNEKD